MPLWCNQALFVCTEKGDDMPYIEVEELAEGQEAADVRTREEYDALSDQLTAMTAERDTLQQSVDTLSAERDKLTNDLAEAKTRFADVFLTQKPPVPTEPAEPPYRPATFSTLFGTKE